MPTVDAPLPPSLEPRPQAPPVAVSQAGRDRLLEIAIRSLTIAVTSPRATIRDAGIQTEMGPATGTEAGAPGGAFVTLWEDGELRGCVGYLDETMPLGRSVGMAAVAAANDLRFDPVTVDELGKIEVEVSVVGPSVRLDDPLDFRLGTDGLIVVCGASRGVLLPEVAERSGFDHAMMLAMTCLKAGLPPDAWRWQETRVLAFRTARFARRVSARSATAGGASLAGR